MLVVFVVVLAVVVLAVAARDDLLYCRKAQSPASQIQRKYQRRPHVACLPDSILWLHPGSQTIKK